jgi:hypothetical protein
MCGPLSILYGEGRARAAALSRTALARQRSPDVAATAEIGLSPPAAREESA